MKEHLASTYMLAVGHSTLNEFLLCSKQSLRIHNNDWEGELYRDTYLWRTGVASQKAHSYIKKSIQIVVEH